MKSKRISSEMLLHPVACYKWRHDKESPQSKRQYKRKCSQQGHLGQVAMVCGEVKERKKGKTATRRPLSRLTGKELSLKHLHEFLGCGQIIDEICHGLQFGVEVLHPAVSGRVVEGSEAIPLIGIESLHLAVGILTGL